MEPSYYYDRQGRPVSRIQWHQLGRQPGYSDIAHAALVRYGRRIIVDTRWVGTAHGAGPARIFQTYGEIRRRGAPRQGYRRRWGWTTIQAARTGHQEIVGWLTGVAAWLAGVTDQMPPPPQVLAAAERDPLAASARPEKTVSGHDTTADARTMQRVAGMPRTSDLPAAGR